VLSVINFTGRPNKSVVERLALIAGRSYQLAINIIGSGIINAKKRTLSHQLIA